MGIVFLILVWVGASVVAAFLIAAAFSQDQKSGLIR
jgi:hypothetical protein